MKKILFVINPIAGIHSKERIPDLIHQYIDKEKFQVKITTTEYAGHGTMLSKKAVQDGFDIIAVVGGDGSVNEVARALIHTDTAMAIIPSGSGNGLAHDLGIPTDKHKAFAILNKATIHRIDTATINGHYFFSNAGLGFESKVAYEYAKTTQGDL